MKTLEISFWWCKNENSLSKRKMRRFVLLLKLSLGPMQACFDRLLKSAFKLKCLTLWKIIPELLWIYNSKWSKKIFQASKWKWIIQQGYVFSNRNQNIQKLHILWKRETKYTYYLLQCRPHQLQLWLDAKGALRYHELHQTSSDITRAEIFWILGTDFCKIASFFLNFTLSLTLCSIVWNVENYIRFKIINLNTYICS